MWPSLRPSTVSPGKRDDPLHEILDRRVDVRRRLEHDDVAAVHRVQLVRELVDDDPVVGLERRDHRLRRDVERLEEERLDQQRDGERADDEDRPLERDGPRRFRLAGGGRRRRAGRGREVVFRPAWSRPAALNTGFRRSWTGSPVASSHARPCWVTGARVSGRRPGDDLNLLNLQYRGTTAESAVRRRRPRFAAQPGPRSGRPVRAAGGAVPARPAHSPRARSRASRPRAPSPTRSGRPRRPTRPRVRARA